MKRSTKKNVFSFIVATTVGLPVTYFFAKPFDFWVLFAMVALTVTGWSGLGLLHLRNRARFGDRMTFEDIRTEEDPIRMVQLIRYHLGWSPNKIVKELNGLGIRNHGLPWRESDVDQVVKRVRRVL